MKNAIYIMFAGLLASTGLCSYTHEVYTYGESKTLNGTESILIDQQGGMDSLTLYESGTAMIKSTSDVERGVGGIWTIDAAWESHFDMSGGQVHRISIGDDATAFLSGGLIQELRSFQNAWKWEYFPEPARLVWNPHITIECLTHSHNTQTNVLTVQWLDGSSVNIQLTDVQGYSPVIQNIQFVPEPTTLLIFAVGGITLLRKRR